MSDKKLDVTFKEGKIVAGYDGDKDGEKSLSLEASIKEAYGEILARGEKVEGEKVVVLKMEKTTLVISIDSDRDGEKVLDLRLDLGEVYEEFSA